MNDIGEYTYWAGLGVSFVIGYMASVLSGFHVPWMRRYFAGRYLRSLLKFGADEVIVVYPHQQLRSESNLPQVAVEDVVALRNVLSVLNEVGIGKPKIRHPENLSESDLKRNLVSIGGPIRNSLTREILKEPVSGDILDFVQASEKDNEVLLKRGETMTYRSPSYSGDGSSTTLPDAKIKDVAIILRRSNPKNESCSVIVLAGIRGVGTWGASDHLRKYAARLFKRIRKDPEGALSKGYLAVLDVEYEKFDISTSRVKDVTSVSYDA